MKNKLTFRKHPLEIEQFMHAESYDINERFLALLWSPSLDMDISSPAAGFPSFPSW